MNDATKAPELLPCPFCGAEMDDWHGQSFTHPLVEKQEDACILAGLSFSYQHSRWGTQETVRWNRRATPAALAASPEAQALIREAEARGMERMKPVLIAYEELLATVQGECSSLLDPCRGGSDVLANLIIQANTIIQEQNNDGLRRSYLPSGARYRERP